MLAPNNELKNVPGFLPPIDPIPQVEYSGFPWWLGMLVEPNRETRSADRLMRVRVYAFLPMFSKVVGRRAGVSRRRAYAVLPGMMFVPEEFMDIPRRDEVLEWAHVRGFVRTAGGLARISKADIEIIREIEAKLNTIEAGGVPGADGKRLEVGMRVRFLNSVYAAFFGDGLIIEIAGQARIGVEVIQLFGCTRMIYVPASEIEAM